MGRPRERIARTLAVLLAARPRANFVEVRVVADVLRALFLLFLIVAVISAETRQKPLGWPELTCGALSIAGACVAYLFARRGQSTHAGRTLALTTVGCAFFAALLEVDPTRAVASLDFECIGVLWAAFLLPPRETATFGLVASVAALLAPELSPVLQLHDVVLPCAFLAFASTLLVIVSSLRHRQVRVLEQRTRDLAEGEERLRVTLDSSLDAVITADADGAIVDWSRHAEEAFGCVRAEALGRDVAELVFPERVRSEVRRILAEVAREPDLKAAPGGRSAEPARSAVPRGAHAGRSFDGLSRTELIARRADGTEVPVELSASGISLRGRPGVAMFLRDLSERRRMFAELVQADRLAAIGRLAAAMAHEINNPMTYVLTNLGLARGKLNAQRPRLGLIGDELATLIGDAHDGAKRVRSVVHDLRTFTHGGTDEQSEVDLARVLDGAAQIASAEIHQRAKLVKSYDPVPPVFGSEARLGQVFLNLLLNAAEALPPDKKDQEVRIRLEARDGRVVASVTDTGPGIPDDVRARLFSPFFTTKPVGQGMGLGLYVSQSIVHAHGGQILVASTIGQGTTFSVVLPPAPPRVSSGAQEAPSGSAPQGSTTSNG